MSTYLLGLQLYKKHSLPFASLATPQGSQHSRLRRQTEAAKGAADQAATDQPLGVGMDSQGPQMAIEETPLSVEMNPQEPPKTILDLPTELIGMIQQELPLYDAIKLGLASRRLHRATDPRLWAKVRCSIQNDKNRGVKYVAKGDDLVHDEERWAFLKGLEPQVPHLELCHYCRIFHPRATLQDQSLWRAAPTGVEWALTCDNKEVHFRRLGIEWGFGFRDIYAIMTNHALSRQHGIPLSDLCISTDWTFVKAYKNLHNASRSPFKRFVSYTKLDTEAIIHHGHLQVHRIQRLWVPIHLQGTDVLIRYGAGDLAGDFKICMHHGPQSGEMISNFTIPLREGLKYVLAERSVSGSNQDGPLPRIIKRCEDCPTEYSISFHVHGEKSVEIVLDVWQNLGDCQFAQATGWFQNLAHNQFPMIPGWLNCWGMLNPRVCDIVTDEAARTSWHQSAAHYVADASVFPTPAWKSEVAHASSTLVLQEFAQLQSQVAASGHSHGVNLGVVPQLSLGHLRNIRSSYVNARYEANLRRRLPPFLHKFRLHDGQEVPFDEIKYTRTKYYGSGSARSTDMSR
ncbi:hypothetical protein PFICI_03028 [Pestalotiopsis fici W106-1]|uniref:F-box domain-containing protein n=1 Tax=Pestalotiopsis fici (strain W106-1 / CGMCC3.15140) TaxID=1229662 RepID=W3XFX4_PESFW|nr:uncharacterized protein PFICI_03028 [Pestalotiopsis fici W106-1]ETS85003.1 hypothetical protein PFICI_03028 [Pestalotiopsis fici W106-1]